MSKQLSDVLRAEHLAVTLEKRWRIPIRVRKKGLGRQAHPMAIDADGSGSSPPRDVIGIEITDQNLSDGIKAVQIDS